MALTPEWVRMMARYNAWQNGWMIPAASDLTEDERWLDRGAFFSSIHGTLSHLLWADTLWMSRFDKGEGPEAPVERSTKNYADWDAYVDVRSAMDERITRWAGALTQEVCDGELAWHSGALDRDMVQPMSMMFTQFFNHQTHHRGQVHAMLTAAGAKTSDTDLIYMEY